MPTAAAPVMSALMPAPVRAEIDLNSQLDYVNETAGYNDAGGSNQLQDTIGTLISVFLGLLGIVFLLLTIYAGWLWMTAQGDPKKVEKATTLLTQAVIGLVILLSAYAISSFVIDQLTTATGNG
jgi:hypothetical protein